MFDPNLESLAKNVRANAGAEKLPVNIVEIADYDDLILEPVTEHVGFNGKIEFLPADNVFVIFHPDPATYPYKSRLRFSIAHEFAHFHIDEHREALVRGETHNSMPGFRSKHPREIQADEFAAALLIPLGTMEPQIRKRGFLTLQEICSVARQCEVSPYATAIRYVRMAEETCFVVLAKNGQVVSSFSSDEACTRRMGRLQIGHLPAKSPGHSLASCSRFEEAREIEHPFNVWYPEKGNSPLWESCTPLGEGYTLSLVSAESAN